MGLFNPVPGMTDDEDTDEFYRSAFRWGLGLFIIIGIVLAVIFL